MTLPRLWAFLAIVLPALAALAASMSTVDLAYQLRAGAEITSSGMIPRVDTWTFTVNGQPWIDQQWGAQVALSWVYGAASWTGLAVLRAGLVAVTFGCVFAIGRINGLSMRTSSLLALGSFAIAAPALALRPQLFGLAIFAVILLVLAIRRDRPRVVWVVPVLVCVWANVHGSFVLGPLAVGLAWLADLRDGRSRPFELLGVAIVSALAACVTPFGPAVWTYAFGLSTDPSVTGRISEWQRTLPTAIPGLLFYASVVAVVALALRRRGAITLPIVLWLVVFGGIGVYAVRGIAWWALAMVPVVATLFGPATAPERQGTASMRRINALLAIVLGIVGVALLPVWRHTDPGTGAPEGLLTDAPSGVTAKLRSVIRPGDHLFNPQPWGSWIEFSTPDALVAVDSRVELFPSTVWDAYDAVRAGAPGWEDILAAWDVDLIAVEPDQPAMVDRLSAAGWTVVSKDDSGAVLRRPA